MMRINNKTGFTLVEMLIAISIFAVVATLASSLFSTFANNQKRIKVSQELLNNAQYALEIISREVKNNEIIGFGANQCLGLDPVIYTKCLLFARENGETAGFVYKEVDIGGQLDIQLAYVQLDCVRSEAGIYSNCTLMPGQEPAIMLSAAYNKVNVTDLDFLLTPIINPYFDETGVSNQQPRVTIKMKVEYESIKMVEQITHYLQTTVSSRVYKR